MTKDSKPFTPFTWKGVPSEVPEGKTTVLYVNADGSTSFEIVDADKNGEAIMFKKPMKKMKVKS